MLPYFPSGKNDAGGDLYCNGHCISSVVQPHCHLSCQKCPLSHKVLSRSVLLLMHQYTKAHCEVSRVKV